MDEIATSPSLPETGYLRIWQIVGDREDGSSSILLGNCADGSRPVPAANMSEGTIDQLFLALRVASIEQSVKGGVVLPVLADDLFINFDNQRAAAGFRVLGELAKSSRYSS